MSFVPLCTSFQNLRVTPSHPSYDVTFGKLSVGNSEFCPSFFSFSFFSCLRVIFWKYMKEYMGISRNTWRNMMDIWKIWRNIWKYEGMCEVPVVLYNFFPIKRSLDLKKSRAFRHILRASIQPLGLGKIPDPPPSYRPMDLEIFRDRICDFEKFRV